MHPVRLNVLRKAYPKDDCLSAVSTAGLPDYGIASGTPLIVTNEALVAAIPHRIVNSLGLDLKMQLNKSGGYSYIIGKNGKNSKVSLAELYSIVHTHTDEVLAHSVSRLRVLDAFGAGLSGCDHTLFNLPSKKVAVLPSPPLFWEDGLILETTSVCELVGTNDLATKIHNMLSAHRYVTYCYKDFSRNSVGDVIEDIRILLGYSVQNYPIFRCYSWPDFADMSVLLDVCSITFFRLSDTTAVYDRKKAVGYAVDIFACSSQMNSIANMPGSIMLVRFVFNADRENLFAVDGEVINSGRWPNKGSIADALSYTRTILLKNSPRTIV